MNRLFYSLLLFLAIVTVSMATPGLIVEQTVSGMTGQEPIQTTLSVCSDRIRSDDPASTTIIRYDMDKYWIFSHSDKTWLELSQQTMLQIVGMASAIAGAGTDSILDPQSFKRTGKTRKIGEWDCYEVALDPKKRGNTFAAFDKIVLWVSNQPYPLAKPYLARVMQMFGVSQQQLPIFEKTIGTGFPIESTVQVMDMELTTRVNSIRAAEVAPSKFEPIPGYQKQQVEDFMKNVDEK